MKVTLLNKRSVGLLLIAVLLMSIFGQTTVLADQTSDMFPTSATGSQNNGSWSSAIQIDNSGPELKWDNNHAGVVTGFANPGISGTIDYVRFKVTIRADQANPRGEWNLRWTTNGVNPTDSTGYEAFAYHRTLSSSYVTETVDKTTKDGTNSWTNADIANLKIRLRTQPYASGSGAFYYPDAINVQVFYTPPDTTPPSWASPSTALSATNVTGSSVTLQWTAATDNVAVAGYQVYRDGSAIGSFVSSPTVTFTDNTVSQYTTYQYKVSAKDTAGNWSTGASQYTNTVTVQTLDTTAPSQVNTVTVQPVSSYGVREFDITWNAASDPTPGSGVSYYEIYDADTSVLLKTYTHSAVTSFTYRTSGLGYTPNTVHRYYIKAVDNSGNISTGNTFQGTTDPDTLAPNAVNTLTAVAESSSRIRLQWDKVTDDWGIAHYWVYRNSALAQQINYDPNLGSYTWSDNGLNPNTNYSYYVQPVDIYGNVQTVGNNTSQATTLPVDTQPPTQPANLSATVVGTSAIDLTWTASTDNVGVAGYYVYQSVSGGAYNYRATAAGTSYSDTGLTQNTTYGYYVKAFDEAGNVSAQSNTAVGTTQADSSPPTVTGTTPVSNTNNVGRAVYIKAFFSEALNPATVNATNVVLKDVYNNTVATAITLESGNTVIQIDPTSNLASSTLHTVYLKTGIQDLVGLSLASEYSWNFTTGTSDFFVPHGNYGETPNACVNCHSSHTGQNARMIRAANVSSVCFTCHNGTGAKALNNIQSQFDTAGGNTVFHPVKNTNASAGGSYTGLIECVTCHNPHGDLNTVTGQVYPKLLKQKNGATYVFQGNAFCLACHGTTDRQWSLTYYSNTAGDHTSNTMHYDTTKDDLRPPSGTQITCVMCHNKHASPYTRLNLASQENLCFNCHYKPENSINHNRNIQDEFNRTGSKHNIDANGSGGIRVECYNCHNTHMVTNVRVSQKQSTSVVTNPDNTKQYFTDTVNGKITGFCLKCHDGSPPTAVVNSTTLVPYTVTFPNRTFTDNAGGFNKSLFTDSGHHTNATVSVDCLNCHEPHGALYSGLRKYDEDTATTDGICFNCHAGQYAQAPNVKTDLTKAYRHPTLYSSQIHDAEETFNFNTATNRHAECYDCHDMHAAKNTAGTPASGDTPPTVSGIIRNVYGVGVTQDPGTRPAASAGSAPGSMAYNSSGYTWKQITYMFELCYKCHSSYSFGNTPANSPNPPYTDVASEFNPNNASYHPIEKRGRTPYGTYVGTDSFGNAIGVNTILYCTDCHGSDNSGIKGPHGSANARILKKQWSYDTGNNITNQLCFNCHSSDVYSRNGTNGNGAATGFNDWNNSSNDPGNSTKGNLHLYHAQRQNDYGRCQNCHVRIPHGWTRRALIGLRSDPEPYIEKTGGTPTTNKIVGLPSNFASGQYSDSNRCGTSHAH